MGWNVLTIWECQLKKKVRDEHLRALEQEIRKGMHIDRSK